MLDWIRQNYSTISVLTNAGMLIVWIVYLQLFLQSYKRQRRSKILINVGAGRSIDARCLVSNMSAEPVYLESIIATLERGQEKWTSPVTDVEELTPDHERPDYRQLTRQGPLMPGAVMDLGSYRDLIGRVVHEAGWAADGAQALPENLRAIEIQAIADFGPEDLLVGARRRFALVQRGGGWALGPEKPYTEQIRSRRERKRIRRMLKESP
jgi:hypothetical protein